MVVIIPPVSRPQIVRMMVIVQSIVSSVMVRVAVKVTDWGIVVTAVVVCVCVCVAVSVKE